MSIFFRIKYENCQEISSSQLDNGLLEIVLPKNCSNSELNQYLNNISSDFDVIENKQKKATESFRKKVKQLIEKYKEEFNLDLRINLRIQTKTQKINDCHVQVHGISFDTNMSLITFLQFASDDILEKIVRCTVYDAACQYENLCSEYRIPISGDEYQKMTSDYNDASKQLNDFLKKNPILSIK